MRVMYPPRLCLNIRAVAVKIRKYLKKKKHDFQCPHYKVRRPFKLETEERGGANLPLKGPQTQSAPGRGRYTMKMMMMMMMIMMMTIMTWMSFLDGTV